MTNLFCVSVIDFAQQTQFEVFTQNSHIHSSDLNLYVVCKAKYIVIYLLIIVNLDGVSIRIQVKVINISCLKVILNISIIKFILIIIVRFSL